MAISILDIKYVFNRLPYCRLLDALMINCLKSRKSPF